MTGIYSYYEAIEILPEMTLVYGLSEGDYFFYVDLDDDNITKWNVLKWALVEYLKVEEYYVNKVMHEIFDDLVPGEIRTYNHPNFVTLYEYSKNSYFKSGILNQEEFETIVDALKNYFFKCNHSEQKDIVYILKIMAEAEEDYEEEEEDDYFEEYDLVDYPEGDYDEEYYEEDYYEEEDVAEE